MNHLHFHRHIVTSAEVSDMTYLHPWPDILLFLADGIVRLIQMSHVWYVVLHTSNTYTQTIEESPILEKSRDGLINSLIIVNMTKYTNINIKTSSREIIGKYVMLCN